MIGIFLNLVGCFDPDSRSIAFLAMLRFCEPTKVTADERA